MHPQSPPSYLGQALSPWCRIWVIMLEVAHLYYLPADDPHRSILSISIAGRKFRELLAWSESISPLLTRDQKTSYHMTIFR